MRELVFSFRSLLRSRLLVATAVTTLGVGLGISLGVLAVAYALLIRPLPFADPAGLVAITIHPVAEPAANIGVPLTELAEWRDRSRAFEGLTGYSRAEFTLRGAGEPRSVRVAMIADGFFDTLGVAAASGDTSQLRSARPVAAISARLTGGATGSGSWRGRVLMLGDRPFDVSAVMSPSFTFPSEEVGAWVPAGAVAPISLFSSDDRRFRMIARLAPGISVQQAGEDVRRVADELNLTRAERDRLGANVETLDDMLRRDARQTLVPFVLGALLVLVIAAANVSGLLAGRAAGRTREVAVRRALGGTARRVLSVTFADAAIIAVGAWTLGLVIGHIVVRAFVTLGAETIPRIASVGIGVDAVIGSLLLACAVATLSAIPATVRVLRADPGALLKGAHDTTSPGGLRLRRGLVAAQIALTIVLLVCAGLLTRTVITIISPGPGFTVEGGLTTRLMLSQTIRYRVTDRAEYLAQLLAEIRRVPGVVSAGVGSDLPPRGAQVEMTIRLETDGRAPEIVPLSFSAVTPGYLESLGVRLIAGRLFEERDRLASEPTVVVSRSAARKVFDDRDPIGRQWAASIPTPNGDIRPVVIGVIDDIKSDGLDREAGASIYAPWETFAPSQAYLVVRSAGDPMALAPVIRSTIARLDPTLPVYTPESLEQVVAGSIAERRLRLQLAVTFAGLALALAVVATGGTVAQAVADRRRELAIRMALGASTPRAVRLMVGTGLLPVGVGLLLGLLGAAVSARAIEHLLHGIAPLDPLTFGGAASLAIAVSLLACYGPARRAAAISPAELLRER